MGFFETVAEAFDPEAFSDGAQRHPGTADGLPEARDYAARRDAVNQKLSTGLGAASREGFLITKKIGDVRGSHWWVESGLTMSPAKLGAFVAAVLRHRGNIVGFHALSPQAARSTVVASVTMPEEEKASFEAESKLVLKTPKPLKLA